MNIKLASNEDLTITTKNGNAVTVPSPASDDTLVVMGDIQFKEWFPGGEAKSIADCTADLRFDWSNADTTNHTVKTLSFCNTGTLDADNSDKTGRVVIPPYVDHDGERYTVVGVANGSANSENTGLTGVVTPTTVTDIGDRAFCWCTSLASISFSAATSIGDDAFDNCDALATVSLPAATSIGVYAFSGCAALATVSLPAATSIGGYAFYYCPSLLSVSLPSATSIGDSAFYYCPLLSSTSLPAVITVGESAFSGCAALASVSLPSATSIGDNAFDNCDALATVSLPAATSIGVYAFSGCAALATVSLPAATSIGGYAFYYCPSLLSVSLPSATSIGDNAFDNCDDLSSVDFGPTARQSVPTLGTDAFPDLSQSGHTCRIVVPDAQYDDWKAATGWSDLVASGYTFLRHSDWEYARIYDVTLADAEASPAYQLGSQTDKLIMPASQRNFLPIATATDLSPYTYVYRVSAASGVIPTMTASAIPSANAYYCFEMEISVPSGETLDSTAVSSWTWLDGGELPTTGYDGKTLYVAGRLDCASREFTANCWRVA